MGADVVEDDVDLAPRIGAGEPIEEGQEVARGVPLAGLGRDRSGADLEGGEQAGRAVTLVVVGAALHPPGLHRQHRLGVIEGPGSVCPSGTGTPSVATTSNGPP